MCATTSSGKHKWQDERVSVQRAASHTVIVKVVMTISKTKLDVCLWENPAPPGKTSFFPPAVKLCVYNRHSSGPVTALTERGFCGGRLMATGRQPKHSHDGKRSMEEGQRGRNRLEEEEELVRACLQGDLAVQHQIRRSAWVVHNSALTGINRVSKMTENTSKCRYNDWLTKGRTKWHWSYHPHTGKPEPQSRGSLLEVWLTSEINNLHRHWEGRGSNTHTCTCMHAHIKDYHKD